MYAAVVTSFDSPPRYQEMSEPVAHSDEEEVVDVLAAALHPRVRSQADGSHYTSTGVLPLVPGIDGVVRDGRGNLRYALLDDNGLGTMAQRTVIEKRRSVLLDPGSDPVAVAAAVNPAMSSWVALRRRIDFHKVASVLVLGATGNAGRTAVQVARRFGAAEVVAAGRDESKLAALREIGADRTFLLDQLAAAADVDVVIDYLWGAPAARAMTDILSHRQDRSRSLDWIAIGSVAGDEASIPSAALRAARLSIMGSGIGSVSARDFSAELPEIAAAASRHEFAITPRAIPLAEVEQTWNQPSPAGERVVFTL